MPNCFWFLPHWGHPGPALTRRSPTHADSNVLPPRTFPENNCFIIYFPNDSPSLQEQIIAPAGENEIIQVSPKSKFCFVIDSCKLQ